MDFGNILPTVLENFTRLAPIRIIHSYEQGVKFRFGKDIALLEAGVHVFVPFFESIETDSTATRYIITPLQDLITKDNVLVSTSGSLSYSVYDFRKHWVKLQDREDSLMNLTQRAIADSVTQFGFEDIKNSRSIFEYQRDKTGSEFNSEIFKKVKDEAREYGINAESFGLITFTRPKPLRLIVGNNSYQQVHSTGE